MKRQGRGRGMAVLASLAVSGLWTFVGWSQGSGATAAARRSEAPATRPDGATSPRGIAGRPAGGNTVGVPVTGVRGITETVATIMQRARTRGLGWRPIAFEGEEVRRRPFVPADDPLAPAVPSWPPQPQGFAAAQEVLLPQVAGTNFKAVGTAAGESPFIPPDSMGDVGPTQILVHVNGRIKIFDKTGAVGGLNSDDLSFWDSVRAGQELTDPEVRYDRLTGRWFALIVTFPATNNLVLLAVSSGPTITDASSFTFFSFPIDLGGVGESTNFCDYPGFGVDANALYVGCNMFSGAGLFQHTTGYVIRKSSVLGGGPIVVTPFVDLTGHVTAGPFAPRGIDNDDPLATEGYFIGPDIAFFSRLVLRRVTNPGGTPALSGNLNLAVPTTSLPLTQPASGSTTNLDTSDDRLFTASIHRNKITGATTLWTAHNIAVTSSCVGASNGGGRRNGARWYEIGSLTATPALVQSGTLCDTATTNPRGFIYPSVVVTGQGHMALGSTFAASNLFAGVSAAGRLRTDAPGSTQAPTVLQNGLASYTIAPPPSNLNRWGDYSFTDVDPNDDQTVWTVQEYADSPMNNWAVRVIQLLAPPPASPSGAAPSGVCSGLPSVSVAITGTSASGSGFFDPGSDPGGPGFARRITSTVSGGVTVTGVTFTDPTHLTLTLDTTAASSGPKNVTITNPDGQAAIGSGILTVNPGPAQPAASNNGPVCAGGTLQLTASAIPGATYSWTGPNGFTSSQQNPAIAGASTAAAGTYSVRATVGGCISPAGTTAATIIANQGACNDGNACTTGETCAGGVCGGGSVSTPVEVNDSVALSDNGGVTTISWTDPPGTYSVYRGTRTDGSPWSFNQTCLAPRIGTSSATDSGNPPALTVFFYLVTRVDACGESIPGRDSNGTPEPNPSPCP